MQSDSSVELKEWRLRPFNSFGWVEKSESRREGVSGIYGNWEAIKYTRWCDSHAARATVLSSTCVCVRAIHWFQRNFFIYRYINIFYFTYITYYIKFLVPPWVWGPGPSPTLPSGRAGPGFNNSCTTTINFQNTTVRSAGSCHVCCIYMSCNQTTPKI